MNSGPGGKRRFDGHDRTAQRVATTHEKPTPRMPSRPRIDAAVYKASGSIRCMRFTTSRTDLREHQTGQHRQTPREEEREHLHQRQVRLKGSHDITRCDDRRRRERGTNRRIKNLTDARCRGEGESSGRKTMTRPSRSTPYRREPTTTNSIAGDIIRTVLLPSRVPQPVPNPLPTPHALHEAHAARSAPNGQ